MPVGFGYHGFMSFIARPPDISPALWEFLLTTQRELMADSLRLLNLSPSLDHLSDYSFVVFPAAKAYEGFLKDYFRHLGILSDATYNSRHFRIGRSFNPDIAPSARDEAWLYDDVAARCGNELAGELWRAWIEGRNHLFHYFPHDRYDVNRTEARDIIQHLVMVMERAVLCL